MNIILTLFSHQWLSFWRSRNSGKSLVLQLIIGFFFLYIIVASIFLGVQMNSFLKENFPNKDTIAVFCSFILYYYFIDLASRFFIQELPTLSIQSYLIKNIRRKSIVRFLNIRSMFNFLNIIPLLLFFPFSFDTIYPKYGLAATIGFDLSIIFLVLFNHFSILYLKRKSIISSWWVVIFFVALLLVGFLDYKSIFSIGAVSTGLFTKILVQPWLAVIPFALFIIAFIICNRHLYKNLYIEELANAGKSVKGSADYSWLNRFGETGELLALEIKLIIRNKRPRNLLTMNAIFLFYGFIVYNQKYIDGGNFGFLLLGAIFMTGLFTISYGNFLLAWQSSHFDALMADRLPIKKYIKSKMILLMVASTISFILTSFYGFISWKLLVIQFAAYIFNMGVLSVITVYLSTYHYKAIDIGKKATFNYEGTGATQWLYALIIFAIPYLIYLPFAYFISNWAGIIALAVTGLISLLLYDRWINFLTKEFLNRKYRISAGFREK